MGGTQSIAARVDVETKHHSVRWDEDTMAAFSAFLDDCCSTTEHGFVQPDVLHSAWISYNGGPTRNHASDLADASGYAVAGNVSHPVILGLSLVNWPSGALTRRSCAAP